MTAPEAPPCINGEKCSYQMGGWLDQLDFSSMFYCHMFNIRMKKARKGDTVPRRCGACLERWPGKRARRVRQPGP